MKLFYSSSDKSSEPSSLKERKLIEPTEQAPKILTNAENKRRSVGRPNKNLGKLMGADGLLTEKALTNSTPIQSNKIDEPFNVEIFYSVVVVGTLSVLNFKKINFIN